MRCPTLKDLPPPPSGKTGWPWTVESPQLPELMSDGKPWPKISIVTPSYNQGQFIEETIRSVLLQGYSDLEYIVMDGGSDDESVAIINRYSKFLSQWLSQRDNGQVDAINRGINRSSGDILNWLNSDDILMPRCLKTIAVAYHEHLNCDLISGVRILSDANGDDYAVRVDWERSWPSYLCGYPDFPQEATFFSKKIWKDTGGLDERMNYLFDVAFYAKALKLSKIVVLTNAILTKMHVHKLMKTLRYDTVKTVEQKILEVEYMPRNIILRLFSRLTLSRLRHIAIAIVKSLAVFKLINYKKFQVFNFDVNKNRWESNPLIDEI